MKEMSKKQMFFVKTYAWVHCVLGIVSLFLFMFSDSGDLDTLSLSSGSLMTKVGAILTFYFFAPLILMKSMGIPLPTINHLEYLWLIFAGFIYGLIYLYIYKFITKQ